MSDHTVALVPVECWTCLSPDQRYRGRLVDVGLLAEALIYYDRVLVNVTTEMGFAALARWFYERGIFDDFVALISEGTITFYHYAFFTAPIEKDGVFSLFNFQDEQQAREETFHARVLQHKALRDAVGAQRAGAMERALVGKVVEVKLERFGPAVEAARRDAVDADTASVAIQAMLDDLYPLAKLGRAPTIRAEVRRDHRGTTTLDWKVDLTLLDAALKQRGVAVHRGTPLWSLAAANRFLASASQQNCDLFAHSPMSRLLGAKLAEVGARDARIHDVIRTVQKQVEFPDVRLVVNGGRIGFGTVLELRRRASRFREWLQQEGEHDRDALISYHQEVASGSTFRKYPAKVLRLFKVVAPLAARTFAAESLTTQAVVDAASLFTDSLASRLSAQWKPVVFGDWSMRYVAESIARADRERGAILGLDRE
jgi:hypothetical protein